MTKIWVLEVGQLFNTSLHQNETTMDTPKIDFPTAEGSIFYKIKPPAMEKTTPRHVPRTSTLLKLIRFNILTSPNQYLSNK